MVRKCGKVPSTWYSFSLVLDQALYWRLIEFLWFYKQ